MILFLTPFNDWKVTWVFLILFIIITCAKIYDEIRSRILLRRRANEPLADVNYPVETPNLQSDAGEKLPVERSGEGAVTVSQERAEEGCSICLDEFGDDVAVLRCDHLFHVHCIVAWTTNTKWCPLCRRVVDRVVVAKMELGFIDIEAQ